jgi:hypothetical protein
VREYTVGYYKTVLRRGFILVGQYAGSAYVLPYHFKTAKASYSRIRRPYFIGNLTLVKLFSLVQALVGVLGSGIRNYHLRQSF